ncbi:MAG: ATP synthase F0 subunit C [Candidatus Magasanikbacteria bacterium]|nr:ATP synthase F0 subunit C [Candidatus Magasanikbacteria bacterium]
MEAEAMQYLAKGLMVLGMAGNAIGEGLVCARAMEAMGRNPEAADVIFPKMIVACAIVESTAIYSLVAFFVT